MNRPIHLIATALAAVGALNWGLVALAEFDLVAALFGLDFGETNIATRIVYGLVGLAGVIVAVSLIARTTDDPAPHRYVEARS